MIDNQNTQAYQQWERMPMSNARLTVQEIMKKRKLSDEKAIEENKTKLAWDTIAWWDYSNSHNITDDSQRQKLRKTSNMIWIANMIYDASIREWNTDVPASPRDIMTMYKEQHPENWDTILNAIWDTSIDLDKFWVEQWWLPSDEEEQYNWILWWVRDIAWQNWEFWSWPNMVLQSLQQWTYWLQNIASKYTDNSPRDAALAEYAYKTYWKDLSELDNRQISKLQSDLQDPEIRSEYDDIVNNQYINAYWWIVDTLFTAAFPTVKLWFSAADNTPWLNLLSYWLWEWMRAFGTIINYLNPPLLLIRSQLNDHQKDIFDTATWWLWFYKAAKSQRWQAMTRFYISKLADSIPAKEVMIWYNRFKDLSKWVDNTVNKISNVTEWIWDTVSNRAKKVKEKVTPKKISPEEASERAKKYAKKLTWADLENLDTVERALANLEWRWELKSTKDIYDANERHKSELIDLENEILKFSERKYWLEDIDALLETDVTMRWETVPVDYVNPVLDTLNWLIECYEEFPEKAAMFKAMRSSLLKWNKITKLEIANIKREISKAVKEYKPLWWDPAKDKMAARMRRNSRALSEIVRAWFNDLIPWIEDPLKTLDNAYHDSYILWEYLWKKMDKMSDQEQRVPPRWEVRWSRRSVLADLFPRLRGSLKDTWKEFAKERARIGKLNELEMEEYVNEMLKDFDMLREKAWEGWWDISKVRETIEELKNIIDETPREDIVWDAVEPEIIDPEEPVKRNVYDSNLYLNDKVTVEKPESFMLSEDVQYNWQAPIDYTNTTRVTPEWNAWRKWQTIEQNKWEYREWVDKPNDNTNKIKEEYAKKYKDTITKIFRAMWVDKTAADVAATAIQESLFWEIEWWQRTDFLWRKIGKRKNKK